MRLQPTIVRSLMLTLLAGSLLSVHTARADDDGLGGPKVKDNSVPGTRGKLGDGARERGEPRPPAPRAFMRAVESLKAESTPAELRLTVDQESQIQALRSDFEAKVTAYRDANKDEILKLREDVGPRERRRIDEMLRGPGEQPRGERREEMPPREGRPGDDMMGEDRPADKPADKPVDEAKATAARERLKEIMDAAPKPTEAQAAVMGVLTEQQKEHVRTTMEKMAQERRGEMGERGERAGRGEEMLKNLSPEDRERLKNMTPEERREFMREKMQQRGGEKGQRGRGKGGEKQPK